MEMLASPGDAAKGCAGDADTAQGQSAAAGGVKPGTGGRGSRRDPGWGEEASRRRVDEGEPPREAHLGQYGREA